MRLVTPRLVLRPLRRPDLAPFVRYRSDPEVARWQAWSPPFETQEAAAIFQRADATLPLVDGEWRQIAITRDGVLIGDCGVCPSDELRQAEVGITLDPAFHHQGYATEALRAVFGWLFDTHGMHRVRTDVDPRNTASLALMRRAGMREEGHHRQSLWCKGEWTDEVWFGLLRSEWSG